MIETAIYNYISAEPTIAIHLTTWRGRPAVFNQAAPSDTDSGWDDENQYGRLVFALDTSDDPERSLSGNLTVDAIVSSGEEPELLAEAVKRAVDGCFFTDNDLTAAAAWKSTQYFEDPTEKVVGATLIFGIAAFPPQETLYPDFINLLNHWTAKELLEQLKDTIGIVGLNVIGQSELPEAWRPTDDTPAVYWRAVDISPCSWISSTWQTEWETATCKASVMAGTGRVEREISRKIAEQAKLTKRLVFDDLSPLMIDRAANANFATDAIAQGQVTIEATYGILTQVKAAQPLNHISTKAGGA